MSIQVTLHVFSGRPNPTWMLGSDAEDDLLDRLSTITEPTTGKPSGVLGRLGYRGFSLSRPPRAAAGPMDLFVHEAIVDRGTGDMNLLGKNRGLETWLLAQAPQSLLHPDVHQHVTTAIQAPPLAIADHIAQASTPTTCPTCVAKDAPAYRPGRWNKPAVQPYNNCYNYANDQITNTFAQPGRAHGLTIKSLQCGDVQSAAHADGLVAVPDFSVARSAGQGWYVTLVVWPEQDFHWYRQDGVGCWSHKPGQTAVRNVDNAGHRITDPRTADRGPYSDFCTFMVTTKSVIIK